MALGIKPDGSRSAAAAQSGDAHAGTWAKFVARYSAYFRMDLSRMAGAQEWREWVDRAEPDSLFKALSSFADDAARRGVTAVPGLSQIQHEYMSARRASDRLRDGEESEYRGGRSGGCGLCMETGWIKVAGDAAGKVYDVKNGEKIAGTPYPILVPCVCGWGDRANRKMDAAMNEDAPGTPGCYSMQERTRFKAIGFPFNFNDRDIQDMACSGKSGGENGENNSSGT